MIVIMPMAGRGSRFAGSGYQNPKPLIEVEGKPMFVHAFESVAGVDFDTIIIVTLKEHEENFGVSNLVAKYLPSNKKVHVVVIDDVTEGQLCTVLAARGHFQDLTEEILIVASDTIILSPIGEHIRNKEISCEGIISVKNMPGEQWSFAKIDGSGKVVEVAEKVRISDHASTGIYYFSNAQKFCSLADEMIQNNERTRGEFYVIPVYQKMIERGALVKISEANEMWDMGTPDALRDYLSRD